MNVSPWWVGCNCKLCRRLASFHLQKVLLFSRGFLLLYHCWTTTSMASLSRIAEPRMAFLHPKRLRATAAIAWSSSKRTHLWMKLLAAGQASLTTKLLTLRPRCSFHSWLSTDHRHRGKGRQVTLSPDREGRRFQVEALVVEFFMWRVKANESSICILY